MIKLRAIWIFVIWGIPEIWKHDWKDIKPAWAAAKIAARLYKKSK